MSTRVRGKPSKISGHALPGVNRHLFSRVGHDVRLLVPVLLVMLGRCADERDAGGQQDGAGRSAVVTEFLYLPDEERMVVTATAESTVVERWNAADSCLATVRKANGDTARRTFDSLLTAFERVEPGEYEKAGVIDGTRIRIRRGDSEIFCDNCLHDFVLEAVGVATGGTPRSAYLIRDVVKCVNELALLAEGVHEKGMRRTTVILDKRMMDDTTKAYEIDTTSKHTNPNPKEE